MLHESKDTFFGIKSIDRRMRCTNISRGLARTAYKSKVEKA